MYMFIAIKKATVKNWLKHNKLLIKFNKVYWQTFKIKFTRCNLIIQWFNKRDNISEIDDAVGVRKYNIFVYM